MASQNAASSIAESEAMLLQASPSNSVESDSQTVEQRLRSYKDHICKVGEYTTRSYNNFLTVTRQLLAHQASQSATFASVLFQSATQYQMIIDDNLCYQLYRYSTMYSHQKPVHHGLAILTAINRVPLSYTAFQAVQTKLLNSLDQILKKGDTEEPDKTTKLTTSIDSEVKDFLLEQNSLKSVWRGAQTMLNAAQDDIQFVNPQYIFITIPPEAQAENKLKACLSKMMETGTRCSCECPRDV